MELQDAPVRASCHRAMRFHLGSIAFGSLIIATIQFIRATINYIKEHSQGQQNKLTKALFCLVQCCLRCLQSCLDVISKNAYVWTAIYGDDFIQSACSSFSLLGANLARLLAVTMVGGYLLTIGKFIVALMSTGVYALILKGWYGDKLSSIAMPCFVAFILAYLVASLFMVSFETTIDTLFLCFLVDEKYNKGSGQMFAPPSLIELIDKHHETSKAKAAELEKGPPTSDNYHAVPE